MLCTASLYPVISMYPLLGQTWRLANYIIMREREKCGAGESPPHPTDALPLALGCDARATESIKSRRLTERDHEGPAVCDCDAVGM